MAASGFSKAGNGRWSSVVEIADVAEIYCSGHSARDADIRRFVGAILLFESVVVGVGWMFF